MTLELEQTCLIYDRTMTQFDPDSYIEDGFQLIDLPFVPCDSLAEELQDLSSNGTADSILFPHQLSNRIAEILHSGQMVELALAACHSHLPHSWRGSEVKLVSSEVHFRPPATKGIPWHQDEAHWLTRDRSLTAIWIPLQDVVLENGPLQFLRGSHVSGRLRSSHLSSKGDPDFRQSMTCEVNEPDDPNLVATVAVPVGSALVFNGYLVHRSLPNRSRTDRLVLSAHFCSGTTSFMSWTGPRHEPGECAVMDNAMVDRLDRNGPVSTRLRNSRYLTSDQLLRRDQDLATSL
jgi:ectoine hydroxylase-related dioxygenase (phytanoyl-CoA dioxygenase family)